MADEKKTPVAKAGGSAPAETKTNKQTQTGEVVSIKMEKTICVQVTRRVTPPFYKRIITKRKKFYAHDETKDAKLGDFVRIIEARPMSKLKRWTLDAIVRRAVQVAEIKA